MNGPGTQRSLTVTQPGERWLREQNVEERCTCHGVAWQSATRRYASGHGENGPYVLVDVATGSTIGTAQQAVSKWGGLGAPRVFRALVRA